MVSKQWQRSQTFIAHLALICVAAVPFGVLETTYSPVAKLFLIITGYLILVPTVWFLHRRFATRFVKVIMVDYEVAARVIQRAFNAQYLRYSKVDEDSQVVFAIRDSDALLLRVKSFDLNLMIDDNLTDQVATMLTLAPETTANKAKMLAIRESIDAAFAKEGLVVHAQSAH